MRRVLPILLTVCLLLCGCGNAEPTEPSTVPTTAAPTAAPTTQPATEPTTEPTTAPTEAAYLYEYWNPLTGEELDAPHTSRIFTVTINNVPSALPHEGVGQADIFFEMLVNDGATRGLALYADPAGVEKIGSVRSARYNFVDICEAYDAILAHAGGSNHVMNKIYNCGIDNLNGNENYFFRDNDRYYSGYDWEHILCIGGDDLIAYAESMEYRTTQDAGKQYGLTFAENVELDGEDATSIDFNFWYNTRAMEYNAEIDKYEFWQYGEASYDGLGSDEIESFKNVLLLRMEIYQDDIYHVANIDGSGEGYYACGGKIIPIQWHHEVETEPFTFTLMDGTPLDLEIGNSYIGFVPDTDTITWE